MKRLYELITDESIKLDESFINEVYELLLSEDPTLEKYISDFKIDYSLKNLGEYNIESRTIQVNPDFILNNDDLFNYAKKIHELHTIKHEIEHARNLKRFYEGGHDIESVIIRYSLIDYAKKQGIRIGEFIDEDYGYLSFRRRENYLIDPSERIADIRANKYIVNLLKNQRNSSPLLIARILLYNSLIRGYSDNRYYLDAPTYTFLQNMGMFREGYLLKKTVDNTNYSLDTRVLLGLPITYDEKDNILLRKVKLQRKR